MKNIFITSFTRIGALFLGLLVTILISNLMPIEIFGQYSILTSTSIFIAIVVGQGFSEFNMRQTSYSLSSGDSSHIPSQVSIVVLLPLLTIIGYSIAFYIVDFKSYGIPISVLILVMITSPLLSWTTVQYGVLRAHKRFAKAVMVEFVIRNLCLIVVFLILYYYNGSINLVTALVGYAASIVLAFIICIHFTFRLHIRKRTDIGGVYNCLVNTIPFLGIATVAAVNQHFAIISTGLIVDSESASLIRVAGATAMGFSMPLMLIVMFLAPEIAKSRDPSQHISISRRSSRLTLLGLGCTLVIGGVFAIFDDYWITSFFGMSYTAAKVVIYYMLAAQVIRLICGPVVEFSNMWGHEKQTLGSLSVAAVVLIVMIFLLVPLYGLSGVGLAILISTLVSQSYLTLFLYKKYGIVVGLLRITQ